MVPLRAALAILPLVLAACDVFPVSWASRERVPPPGQPIPKGADAGLVRNDDDVRLAWGRRHLLEGYERVGRRDPRWDAHARTLIELSIPSLLSSAFESRNDERLAAGRAAIAAGCDDPLVLYLHGRSVWMDDGDSAEPEELYRRAVEGMKVVPYDRALARQAATALFGSYTDRREGINLRPPLQQLELEWFERSLADGSYGADDDVVLTWQLMYGVSVEFVRRSNTPVSEAIDRAEWIDPWVKLHFSGLKHHRAAWAARGRGFASEVKPENWEPFRKESALARRDLEESWRLRPDRPEAAFEMIAVVSGAERDGEDERFWFDRVVRAQMDFLSAYEAMWIHLLPRWGGSYEEMFAFGREALATGRFDTEVPAQLLLIVLRIRSDQHAEKGGAGGQPIFEWPETYPLLVKMFEGYLAEPSRSGEKARWESLWALAADRAGRPQDALRHLEAAGFRLQSQARFHVEKEEKASDFVARVVLDASPSAGEVRRARGLRDAFDVEGALAAYRAVVARDPASRVATALAPAIASLEAEKRMSAGEWVPFLPASADLTGWRTELGSWRLDADGSLVGQAGQRGLLIVSDARVGADFEIRGTMELVSSTNGFYQGGVVFGRPSWDSQEWMSFRMKRNRDEGRVAYFSHHLYRPESGPFPIDAPDRNTFRILVRGGRLSAWVNGAVVQEGLAPKKGLVRSPDLRVGFGGYVDENVVSLRFRDVELRRLTAAGERPMRPRHRAHAGLTKPRRLA